MSRRIGRIGLSGVLGYCLAIVAATATRAQDLWGPGETEILLSEIHFHPADDEEKHEFLELHNPGGRGMDLGGWRFTAGIDYTIPEGTGIDPGGFLVVARHSETIKTARGIKNVVGDFKGNLSNTGETIELRNRAGALVLWICYGDGGRGDGFWPSRCDGEGPSCELLEPNPDWHRSWWWRASLLVGGTPGRASSRLEAWQGLAGQKTASSPERNVRINEVSVGAAQPFVELINLGPTTAKLDGLRLTFNPRQAGGVAVKGTLARRKQLVVDGAAAALATPGGKTLYLVEAETGEFVDSFSLRKGLAPEASLARFPDGADEIITAPKPSPGAANPRPQAADLVINEILFHGLVGGAQASADGEEEFVEIFHRGKSPLPLQGWRLERALSYRFPDDAVIAPGGFVVVTNQPDRLRARIGAQGSALVLGPFAGKLANSGDSVVLRTPQGDVADRVTYSDKAPWPSGTDGGGFSLELLHPDLDNRFHPAWTAGPPGGSPGRKNARAVTALTPTFARVRHEPAAPAPEDEVTVSAQVIAIGPVSDVSMIYRDVNAGSRPQKRSLVDTGKDDDEVARDGKYTGSLPKLRAGVLVGYYLQLRDTSGRTVRYPEGDGEIFVQAEVAAKKPVPAGLSYRVLCAQSLWDQFQRGGSRQETTFPCTLVVGVDGPGQQGRSSISYSGATIRYRGNNSRNPVDGRMSYRVELADGDFFDGRDRFILNAYSSLLQKAGGDVMRAIGVHAPDVAVVRFKTPGFDDFRYVDVEVIKSEFLDRRHGSSTGGIYRGRSFRGVAGRSGSADLSYHGQSSDYYVDAYEQINKQAEARLSSLIRALEALGTKDDAQYVLKVEASIDAEEWATYFAANHILKNNENGLSKGVADDYFIVERPTDGKMLLVAWDHDTVFSRGMGYEPIFGPGVPAVRRFLRHPRFACMYQAALRRLLDGPLSRTGLGWRLDFLKQRFSRNDLAQLEAFAENRRLELGDKYPSWPQAAIAGDNIGVGAGFGTHLYLSSQLAAQAQLTGFADPAVAFHVKALGEKARYDPVTGKWALEKSLSTLAPGSNAIWVELLGPRDEVRTRYSIHLERRDGAHKISGTLTGKVEWSGGGGPYVLEGQVVVASGAVLRLGAGVDVVALGGASLQVRGTLLIEGTAESPVTFRPADTTRNWGGIQLVRGSGGGSGHAIKQGRFEGSVPADEAASRESSRGVLAAQSTRLTVERSLFRGISGFALTLEGGDVKLDTVRIVDGLHGIWARGVALEATGCELARLNGDGLRLGQGDQEVKILGCEFREVLGRAVALEATKATLDSVLLVGCGTGLALGQGSRGKATRLTLAGNRIGVDMDRPQAAPAPGRPRNTAPSGGGARCQLEVEEAVFGIEVEHIAAPPGSSLTLTRSMLAPTRGGDDLKGQGLIRAMPALLDPIHGDYRLRPDAPQGAGWGYAGKPKS